jgi:carbamoylphosphate synthase small subunit
MSKRKATNQLDHQVKRNNISEDFVYYTSARKTNKIMEISPTTIRKRPIYKLFIDYGNKYYQLRCMLDHGSTSFVISPNANKAF